MKKDKLLKRIDPLLPTGQTTLAAAKMMPRGAAHDIVSSAARGVVTGMPGLKATKQGEVGRSERHLADLDLGDVREVILALSLETLFFFDVASFGRPKQIIASVGRANIQAVRQGEIKLFYHQRIS